MTKLPSLARCTMRSFHLGRGLHSSAGWFWLILSELLLPSAAGVCSALHSHSFSAQCWLVPAEVEEVKKQSSSFSLSCPLSSQPLWYQWHTLRSPHRKSFSAPTALCLQQQHLDPFPPHPSCTGKGQLESIFSGTQSPAVLLGTFGYFTTWLI